MYLSFFIKPETEAMENLKKVLEEAGFSVQSEGDSEPDRITFFNGHNTSSFYYTAHKISDFPNEVAKSPFLVRTGPSWSLQGLYDLLKKYSMFEFLWFPPLYFPKKEDFSILAEEDNYLCQKLLRMENTGRNCDCVKRELEIIVKIRRDMNGKSSGEVKKEIFYLYMEAKRIILPWGDPPTGKISRDLLIDWLQKANQVFPRRNSSEAQKKSLWKIKMMKDALTELTYR